MRRFGSDVGDLDVDFTSRPPLLVTDLLRRCGSLTEDAAWNLPVGARTEALVALATLSDSRPLIIALRCPHTACGEALEIEIEPGELRSVCQDRERDVVNVRLGNNWLELRRPTGRDQRNWLGTHWPDIETARARMLASLLSAPPGDSLDPPAIAALEDELAIIDPLVAFNLAVICPACGETAEHPGDLGRHALATLRQIHDRMFESVARLATHFHWTEPEILALPLWRRERYLALAESIQ